MTVQSAISRADYDGNGVTPDFAVPFRFLDKTHLRVIRSVIATGVETELVLDSGGADGFTVTGAGAASGGEVTVVTPPAGAGPTQERITILRNVPATQLLDFITNDAFPAESHERALDLLTMLHGQQGEVLDRAITVPVSIEGFSAELPVLVPGAPLVVSADGLSIGMGSTLGTGDLLLRGDLATAGEASGAALVEVAREETGAVGITVQRDLRARAHVPAEFNAAGDGATDDTAEVQAAINAGRDVYLRGDYRVTSLSNPLGTEYRGPGRLLKAITGGDQQLNTRADEGQHAFGFEYLYALTNKLFNGDLNTVFVCSGDSTVAGDGTTAPWAFVQALASAAYHKGHLISFTNSGHSGKDTSEWVSTYLAADLALNPDCYLVRWGINDPFNGRTIAQYAASLDAGLTTARAARGVDQMTIILMVPNSTSDTPNDRDERWYEQARLVCRAMARKHKCFLFDTYATFQDSRDAAGRWMDNPFADGRAIHPANLMNSWIASHLSDYLFPELLRPRLANGSNYSKNASALPSTYPFGWSHYSTASGDTTFPMKNAHVVTFKSLNGICYQIAQSGWASEVTGGTVNNGNLAKGQFAIRMGQHNGATDTWFAWSSHAPLDLTSLLVNGWVSFAAGNNPSASMNNNVVTLSGLIKSGTTANGTTLFTLPAGWRPRNTVEAFQVSTNTGASTTTATIYVNGATGIVNIQAGANANALSLSGISFEAGQ